MRYEDLVALLHIVWYSQGVGFWFPLGYDTICPVRFRTQPRHNFPHTPLLLGSNVGGHVTFYRGEVGTNVAKQSCWVLHENQNGTPHGWVYLSSSWRSEALKTQPLTPLNGPITPCYSTWTQKRVLLWWGTPMRRWVLVCTWV